MNSSLIYEFDGLLGDSLTVYIDRIAVKHMGVANMIVMGRNKDTMLYYSDIASIQCETANTACGSIRILCPSLGEAYTVHFKNLLNEEAKEIANHLNTRLTNAQKYSHNQKNRVG